MQSNETIYPGHMSRFPWWLLIPLGTCGVGSAPMVIYGGVRLQRRGHIAAGIAYGLLFVVFVVGALLADPETIGVIDAIAFPAWLISWLGGTVHAAVLQQAVRASDRKAPPPVDPVLAEAQVRAERRAQARALLASNPGLAAELLIGRPDLARRYDDGGLVDVNNVPVATLAAELALPPELADQIVAARDRIGGFSSPDELVVYCEGMTTARLNTIRERLIFLPR